MPAAEARYAILHQLQQQQQQQRPSDLVRRRPAAWETAVRRPHPGQAPPTRSPALFIIASQPPPVAVAGKARQAVAAAAGAVRPPSAARFMYYSRAGDVDPGQWRRWSTCWDRQAAATGRPAPRRCDPHRCRNNGRWTGGGNVAK